jgi:hypothetical protein
MSDEDLRQILDGIRALIERVERVVDQRLSENSANPTPTFDLFRLSKAKRLVDIHPNTLHTYNKAGLPFYRQAGGRAVFISRTELAQFIRNSESFAKKRKV